MSEKSPRSEYSARHGDFQRRSTPSCHRSSVFVADLGLEDDESNVDGPFLNCDESFHNNNNAVAKGMYGDRSWIEKVIIGDGGGLDRYGNILM